MKQLLILYKKLPIWLVIAVLVIFLAIFFFVFYKRDVKAPVQPQDTKTTTPIASPEESTQALKDKDQILKTALNLYLEKKQAGTDFSSGPCLGIIAEDWVLDIAHNPLQTVDDKPQNQCADFREGRVHHFIELDPDGKLIKSF